MPYISACAFPFCLSLVLLIIWLPSLSFLPPPPDLLQSKFDDSNLYTETLLSEKMTLTKQLESARRNSNPSEFRVKGMSTHTVLLLLVCVWGGCPLNLNHLENAISVCFDSQELVYTCTCLLLIPFLFTDRTFLTTSVKWRIKMHRLTGSR